MKINIFTLTRDRVEYTRTCFDSLNECRKLYPFNHYVLDNGSTDETRSYLAETVKNYKGILMSPFNYGLHLAASLSYAMMEPCDLVIKVDNDCYFTDISTIQRIANIYTYLFSKGLKYILSPKIDGIVKQPRRGETDVIKIDDDIYHLGQVGQIGGLCMAIPFELFKCLKFNTNLPMARGLDTAICSQGVTFGYRLSYIEDIAVSHHETTDGQAKKYPEYFKRKKLEETKPFA